MRRLSDISLACLLAPIALAASQTSNPYGGGPYNPYGVPAPQEPLRPEQRDPPLAEIWRGDALNARLGGWKDRLKRGARPPTRTLDRKLLRHLNLATDAFPRGLGFLKNEGCLDWPPLFQEAIFKGQRERIEAQLPDLLQQATKDKVPEQALKELARAVTELAEQLDAQIAEITPSQYIEAKRFWIQLKATTDALNKPGVDGYFKLQEKLTRCKTLADLVALAAEENLRFAPAAREDHAAYEELYRLLKLPEKP